MQMHMHTINIDNYYEHLHTRYTKNVPLFILCALTLLCVCSMNLLVSEFHQTVKSACSNVSAHKMSMGMFFVK